MYKLSVNGGLIDFLGEPKIILMASDPLEYSFGKAHKTYYIDILPTRNNDKLLAGNISVDAILFIDNFQIQGILYLDGIEDDVTKGIFVSGIGVVWDNLRGKKLNELDFSQYNHVLNEANVTASEAGGFYVYDWMQRGLTITALEKGEGFSLYFDIIERFPAFNIKGIFDKIFEGYQIVDNLPSWFSSLYLMYTGKYDIRNSDKWLQDNTLDVFLPVLASHTHNVAGSSGSFTTTINPVEFAGAYFLATEEGTYRFDLKMPLNVRAAVTNGGLPITEDIDIVSTLRVDVNSITRGLIVRRSQTVNITTKSNTPVNYTMDVDTRYFELSKNEEIRVVIVWSGTYNIVFPPVTPGGTFTVTAPTTCERRVRPHRYYGVGSTVDVSELMPEVDILDFIKGVCQYYNINVYYNPVTSKVYLWQDDFTTSMDWTDKMLLNKGYTIQIPDGKTKYVYNMAEDGIKTNSGGETFEFGEGESNNINLMFGDYFWAYRSTDAIPSMFNGEFKDITAENGYVFVTNYDFNTDADLRILRFGSAKSLNWTFQFTNIGGAHTTFTASKATIPGFYVDTPNLYMKDMRPPGAPIVQEGIFNKYHRKMIESVLGGEILSCTLLLDNKDLINILYMTDGGDWRTAIHIMGKNYRLLELEQLEGNIYKGRFLQIF